MGVTLRSTWQICGMCNVEVYVVADIWNMGVTLRSTWQICEKVVSGLRMYNVQ